jgi:hypothetical protein
MLLSANNSKQFIQVDAASWRGLIHALGRREKCHETQVDDHRKCGRRESKMYLKLWELYVRNLRLVLSLVLFAISLLIVSCQPHSVIFATSESPDGKYRCVVTEESPRWPKVSPYIYTFTIQEKVTHKDLPGEPGSYNSDSAQISKLEFTWESNRLSIINTGYSPRYTFETAEIQNGMQRWTSSR